MNFNQILRNLWVGSCVQDEFDIDRLREEAGVSTVLNLQTAGDLEYWDIDFPALEEAYAAAGVEIRRVPIIDFNHDDLVQRLPEAARALSEMVAAGHTVYVHCNVGMNRSPTVVIAYLYAGEGWDVDDAMRHVLERRSCEPDVWAIHEADWSGEA